MNNFDEIVQNFFKNYQDRKMKKWLGFFLSDQTLVMERDYQSRHTAYPAQATMTPAAISTQLLLAYSTHRPVHIQLKLLDADRQYQPEISGFVNGYTEESIVVAGQNILLEDIKHIIVE